MSKTYRRKKPKDIWLFDCYHYHYEDGILRKLSLEKDSKEYKRQKARFHSDNYFNLSVPHWYVNLFHEKPNRRKSKRLIQNWMRNPKKDLILDKHFKNAGWNYW